MADWNTFNNHRSLTTGTHGVTGTIVGTSDVQSLTNKQLTMNNGDYIWWKDSFGIAQPILLLAGGGFHIFNPTGHGLNLNYAYPGSIYLWGANYGTGEELVLYGSSNVTALDTKHDSPTIDIAAWFWDGGAPVGWSYKILHQMVTSGATPKSQAVHTINSVDILSLINDNGNPSIYGNASPFSMKQAAIEPVSTANRAGIYAWDLSADNATMGFNTEAQVEVALGVASQNRIPVRWNGVTYFLLAETTSYTTPIVNTTEPTVEEGARVGLLFFNTATNTWKKCTSISPLTWDTLSSGGATYWGGIGGTLSSQTDLQNALNAKVNSTTTVNGYSLSANVTISKTDVGLSDVPNLDTTSAVNNAHTHLNKSVLDNIQEALTTTLKGYYDTAVSLAHDHANMTTLNSITAAFTTELKASYDSAVSAMHSHVNKATLDNITEAFTTSLKSTYDTCASAFTSAYKTTLDTFMASKGAASGIAPLDANSKVPTTNLGGAGADNTKYLRGDQTWATPAGGSNPAWYGKLYGARGNCDPVVQALHENMLSVAGPTPTGITASIARVVQFTPPANITVANIRLFGVGATTNLYKFAIYPVGTGSAKAWDSGTVTTAANTWLNLTSGLPITLTAGTKYWWCVTVVSTGTTAGFRSDAAPLGTNYWGANVAPLGNTSLDLPVYAQFPVTSGVFPAILPAVVAAAYSGGTTGSVPFGWLDYGGAK